MDVLTSSSYSKETFNCNASYVCCHCCSTQYGSGETLIGVISWKYANAWVMACHSTKECRA